MKTLKENETKTANEYQQIDEFISLTIIKSLRSGSIVILWIVVYGVDANVTECGSFVRYPFGGFKLLF